MFKKNNWTDKLNFTQIIVSIVLGLAILGYGYMNYTTKQEELQMKKNAEIQALRYKTLREKDYSGCVDYAVNAYHTSWESACETRKLGEDCSLPSGQATSFNDAREQELDRCVQLYK